MRLVLLAFAAVCVLGSDSPKDYDDRAEQSGLEGTWQAVECNYCGERSTSVQRWTLTLRRGTFSEDMGDDGWQRGTYRLDTTHSPCRLDLNGWRKIYELKRDTLRIAYTIDAPDRYPQDLVGGPRKVITVYKRVR
jgi:uncharacterized protein (TIGR03067 family)